MPTSDPEKQEEYRRRWRKKNPYIKKGYRSLPADIAILRQRERNKIAKNKHIARVREYIIQYKREHPCACGESHVACLQFHHLDPTQKEMTISKSLQKGWARIKNEISKCKVVCANCHLKIHWAI
jgi:hypothetical protein